VKKTFIVCWDCMGVECVIPVTDIEQQNIINILSDNRVNESVSAILHAMLLRARMNPQRFYEIYGITAADGISKEDIEEMFKNSPQLAAETVRSKGHKIYCDRADVEQIKIT